MNGKIGIAISLSKDVNKARMLCALGKATIAMGSMEVVDDPNPRRSMWAKRAGHSSTYHVTSMGDAKVLDCPPWTKRMQL